MKIQKRVLAWLLALAMMVTAVPDMHLWADPTDDTNTAENEWLAFTLKNTDAGAEVTIEKGSLLKNEKDVEIYYKVSSGENDKALTREEISNKYTNSVTIAKTAGKVTEYKVKAYAVWEHQLDSADVYDPTAGADPYDPYTPKSYTYTLTKRLELKYSEDEDVWKVYKDGAADSDCEAKYDSQSRIFTISTPVVSSEKIKIGSKVETPTADPVTGNYTYNQEVRLTSATEGAKIYYTTDGTNPTTASTEYTDKIVVEGEAGKTVTKTINAIAVKDGMEDSAVATFEYTITLAKEIVKTPTANPGSGNYTSNQEVTLTSATEGAKIYYTTDGTDPTTESTEYTDKIAVEGEAGKTVTKTIKAIAVKDGMEDSAVASFEYTIQLRHRITSIIKADDLVFENGVSLKKLKSQLITTKVTGETDIKDADGNPKTTKLTVDWEIPEDFSYDPKADNRQEFTIKGTARSNLYDIDNKNVEITIIVKGKPVIKSIIPPAGLTFENGAQLYADIKPMLPATVTVVTDDGNAELPVTWDVDSVWSQGIYDHNERLKDQRFEITGTVNTNNYLVDAGVSLSVTIQICVREVEDNTPPDIILPEYNICGSILTFTVSDRHLASVTINGVEAGTGGTYTLAPSDTTYEIVATDASGNQSKKSEHVYTKHTCYEGLVTKDSTDKKEGLCIYECAYCPTVLKRTVVPKKSVTVVWGKKLKLRDLISDTTGFEGLSCDIDMLKGMSINSKKGTINTKITTKSKIKKTIPVELKMNGMRYTIKVKIKIPKPTIKITKKNVGNSYRYTFKYNVKGATKIKVRCKEINANALFDKYLSKPKSNKDSYVTCSKDKIKKFKNKLTFKVTAYYGKNVSETYEIRK